VQSSLKVLYYLQSQQYLSRPQPPLLEPAPRERVLRLLEQLESDDLSAWWQLNREMTLQPDSEHYNSEFELDLTKLPGWQEAEESTRIRITNGAKTYIQQQDNIDYEWIGKNIFDRPSVAGCRAFQLLLKENSDFLENLTPEIWKKWAPIIIAAPNSSEHEDLYLEIVKRAYLSAPQESVNALIKLIDKENQDHDYIFSIRRFAKCWDECLKLALLEKAKDPSLKPKCLGELLEELLKQGLTEARNLAMSLVSLSPSSGENEAEKALIAARVLVGNSDPSSWSLIWSLIQQDYSFGREILESAAHHWSQEVQLNLTETQLADLYVWLVRQYPHDEDPDYSNEVLAHFVTAREEMAHFRDSVLSQLKVRGTLQTCAEIQRIVQELPELKWLKNVLIESQSNMRRRTWNPPNPNDLLQLILAQKPSNLDLSNQLNKIDWRTERMADEPKVTNNINVSNSSINAPIGTSGTINSQVTVSSADSKKEFNWGNLIAIVGLLVAIIAILLSMTVSGAFNEEFRQWFNRHFSSNVEQQPKSTNR